MSPNNPLLAELKTLHYAHYLWVMLAPPHARPPLLAVLALDAELAAIADKVSEPMLGHIRYSWWRESFELLEAGTIRQHPLIEHWSRLLATLPTNTATSLIHRHQTHFEHTEGLRMRDALHASHAHVYQCCSDLLQSITPGKLATWQKKVTMLNQYEDIKPHHITILLRLLLR